MGLVGGERFSLASEDPDGSLDIWFYASEPQSGPGRESARQIISPGTTALAADT
jgi:hypothetical protein